MGISEPTQKEKAINADAAKKAKGLLDVISHIKISAIALGRIKDKIAGEKQLSAGDVSEFEAIISALDCIHHQGRQQTAKVSPVTHLLRAYDMRATLDRAKFKQEHPRPYSVSEEMWMLKYFVRRCGPWKPKASNKPTRKSTRIEEVIEQKKKDQSAERLRNCEPPYPNVAYDS